jgi:hypothetical protein
MSSLQRTEKTVHILFAFSIVVSLLRNNLSHSDCRLRHVRRVD